MKVPTWLLYLYLLQGIVFSFKFSQKARKISSIQSPYAQKSVDLNTLDLDNIITDALLASTLNMNEKQIKEFLIDRLGLSSTSSLMRCGNNLNIQVRDITQVGAKYNIFEYIDNNNKIHHILSIRGTSTLKNFRGLVKTKFVLDEELGIKMHGGFYEVYKAIFDDYMSLYGNQLDKVIISINGHSLGGAVSCLMGAALVLSGGHVDKITTFGQPKFTDMVGSLRILFLLQNGNVHLNRIQHIFDPVGRVPLSLPSRDSYQHVTGNFILLDPHPIERSKEQESREFLPATLSFPLSKYISSRIKNKNEEEEGHTLEEEEDDYLWMDDVNEIDNVDTVVVEQIANTDGRNDDPMSIMQDFDWKGRRVKQTNKDLGNRSRSHSRSHIVQKNVNHRVWLDQEADERVRKIIKDAPKFSLQWHYMYQYLHVLEELRKEL